MPQQTLFGGWAITDLTLHVKLNNSKPGGRVEAIVQDEHGKRCEAFTVTWAKDRDISDLGVVMKAVTEAFLWGEYGEVSTMLQTSFRLNCPRVPVVGL